MLPTSTVPTGSASSGESRTFADQQSGTVVGGVGLAQMALLVNGASSQTVWIGSRSRRSRPESPHTRKDGNGNPRGRLPPPGVPPFFLRADAIGAASDRSRTQSEGRSPSVREVQFVAAFPAATTDPTARPASPRVAKRARSSHPGSRLLHDRLAFGSGRAPSEPPQGRSWSRHRTQAGLRWCRYLPQRRGGLSPGRRALRETEREHPHHTNTSFLILPPEIGPAQDSCGCARRRRADSRETSARRTMAGDVGPYLLVTGAAACDLPPLLPPLATLQCCVTLLRHADPLVAVEPEVAVGDHGAGLCQLVLGAKDQTGGGRLPVKPRNPLASAWPREP
jgi:hypothetical protein